MKPYVLDRVESSDGTLVEQYEPCLLYTSMLYKNTDFKTVCVTTIVAAVHVLILVASRDLGGALIFFVTYLVMLYVATRKLFYFAGGLLVLSLIHI